jgi:hypothetical protein
MIKPFCVFRLIVFCRAPQWVVSPAYSRSLRGPREETSSSYSSLSLLLQQCEDLILTQAFQTIE